MVPRTKVGRGPFAGGAGDWLGGSAGAASANGGDLAGPWVDDWATDGTNWTSGVETSNGRQIVSNWPVNGTATFFRLVEE